MPQHYSIRNATPTTPPLPDDVIKLIFNYCGKDVPIINIHAMLVRNRHINATYIQACFKGGLVRHWVDRALCALAGEVEDFIFSDRYGLMLASGDLTEPFPHPWGEHDLTKITTLGPNHRCVGMRPFGGVCVTFSCPHGKEPCFRTYYPKAGSTGCNFDRDWVKLRRVQNFQDP